MKIKEKKDIQLSSFFRSKVKIDKNCVLNNNPKREKIFFKKIVTVKSNYVVIDFFGRVLQGGQKVELRLATFDGKWVSEPALINQKTLLKVRDLPRANRYLLFISVPKETNIEVEKISIYESEKYSMINEKDFKGDVLVITPMYPSLSNPYSATFVYSKVKRYSEEGINTDVAVVAVNEKKLCSYKYAGTKICKISYDDLRNIIQRGRYNKILIHFFDSEICNALLACDLDNIEVMIYCHGADVDLKNKDICSGYFVPDRVFSDAENRQKEKRLEAMQIFERKKNVRWIFNTRWNYENAKKVTGLKFERHEIIPCFVDEKDFPFDRKKDSQRTQILVLKKMDNVRQYAVDIAVRVVLKLSKKPYFKDLHFTFVGAGDYQAELTEPLRKYENVKIENKFYDHDKMKDVFAENGILLAPSRYDTQGVTVGEAAMSGLAVVASKGTGVSDMLPESLGTFFDNKDIDGAVKIIDEIYNRNKKITDLSSSFHDAISKTASTELIKKEIKIIKENNYCENRLMQDGTRSEQKLLTIAIPAYNSEQYIENAVKSLVGQKNVGLLEIIIVNDGSTDGTAKKVKSVLKNASPIVRDSIVFIDKENGGHGSTINAALKVARGKYFRVMDADDRMDSDALCHHLDFLKDVDSDIVFTNTVHDLSIESEFRYDHKYDFMDPRVEYDFDDLCDKYYGFRGYGPVLSTSEVKTDKLREVGCVLPEKSFYVDIIYNYYMTLASRTAIFDPVDLYYYYLGRDGQSLSTESYKRNFYQHLTVLDKLLSLLSENELSAMQKEHFVRVQLHETMAHQYRIALEMFNDYGKFRDVEKVIKKYPEFYNDAYLTPGYVLRMRRFGNVYYLVRKASRKMRPKIGAIKRMILR